MLSAGPKLPSVRPGKAAGRRRLLLLAAAGLAILATARLGWWQLDRAEQKLALQARIDARALMPPLPQAELPVTAGQAEAQHHRPTLLRGRWLPEHTLYLDNRQMNARQGFVVLTPLLLAPGDAVLVQRGWMPRDFAQRSRLQPLPDQPGQVLVPGHLAPPPGKLLTLGSAEQGPIRQNLDLEVLAREIGVALRPLSLQQSQPTRSGEAGAATPPPDDRLLRQWPRVAVGIGKHHGYAFQWFALCALLAGLTLWFQVIRPRLLPQPHPQPHPQPRPHGAASTHPAE